jgi:large subunit ribosomal protein L10
MAKSRAKKAGEISAITDGLKSAKAIVFADISSLKVNDTSVFRRASEKQSVDIQSAKKTLLGLALKDAGITGIDESILKGSVSLLFGNGDEIAPAKLIAGLKKDKETVKIIGGLLESKWIDAKQVADLAKLPSKQELIAKMLGSIRAPLSGLVGVLQGNIRGLVYTLNAIKEAKQ